MHYTNPKTKNNTFTKAHHLSRILVGVLVQVQITLVRMLRAVLGHERRGLDTRCKQVLPKVQDALGQLGRPLLAVRIAVTGPHKLSESGGTRPHLLADNGVVDLLAEQGRDGTLDKRLLGVGQVVCEVVVVDALPCLVRSAP
jgi:hypothetical protein